MHLEYGIYSSWQSIMVVVETILTVNGHTYGGSRFSMYAQDFSYLIVDFILEDQVVQESKKRLSRTLFLIAKLAEKL